jgi:hypothetical protein
MDLNVQLLEGKHLGLNSSASPDRLNVTRP